MNRRARALFISCFFFLCLLIGIPNCKERFVVKKETVRDKLLAARKSPTKTEKYYSDYIKNSTPFKEIIWPNQYTTYGIKRITLLANHLFIETLDGQHLFALDINEGITKWDFNEGELLFPPCIVKELPWQVDELTAQRESIKRKLEEEQKKKGASQQEIDRLKVEYTTANTNIITKRSRDCVYAIVGLNLYCLTRLGGDRLWFKQLTFVPSALPCPSDAITYMPALCNERIYMNNNLSSLSGTPSWYRPQGRITTNVIYSDPFHYFATDKNIVVAMNGDELRWVYPVENKVIADLVMARLNPKETLVLVGSTDYALYALNKNTGQPKWKRETSAPITTTPVVSKGNVYVLSDNNALFSLSLETGDVNWSSPLYKKFLARGKDRIYMYGINDEICSVNEKTGEKIASFSKPDKFDFILSDPETDVVYFATQDGFVFATTESKIKY